MVVIIIIIIYKALALPAPPYGTENWTKAKYATRITAAETKFERGEPQNLQKETRKQPR
jgi:hypothetical protein